MSSLRNGKWKAMISQGPSIDNQPEDGCTLIPTELSVESVQKHSKGSWSAKALFTPNVLPAFCASCVDETLHGNGHGLKEYLLGVEVLGKTGIL